MREKTGKRSWLAYIIAVLLSLYLAAFFSRLYVPDRQLFLDTDSLKEQKVMAFVYDEAPVELLPAGEGTYAGVIRSRGSELQVSVRLRDAVPQSCEVAGKEKEFIPVSRYITSNDYLGTYYVQLEQRTTQRFHLGAILFAGILALFALALRENRREGRFWSRLMYSDAVVRAIGKKPILLSFAVTAISLFIFYGCDLKPLAESIILWQKGVDLFQLFACINPYKSVELYSWQYEGMMLAGYGLPSYLLYPTLGGFQPGEYHWLQSFLYKMLNMLLMNGTVLSLMSFLLERGLLKEERAREVYYFSVFNPLCFWIAIIFIQFDILPVYCTLLGLLLLSDVQKNKWSAALFLGFGVACKLTYLMLLPSMAFLMLTLFVRDKKARKDWLLFGFGFGLLLFVFLLLPRILHTPLHLAYRDLPQTKRLWRLAFPLVSTEIRTYVAIVGLVIAFLWSVLHWDTEAAMPIQILRTVLMLAVIMFTFSTLTLSTPSFYLVSLPAFVLLVRQSRNRYECVLKSLLSLLVVTQFLLRPEGDITATLWFFGKTPVFTRVLQAVEASGKALWWKSFLYSISYAAMLVYLKLFWDLVRKPAESWRGE
ncbi:hypothetical protein [Stomatobaculum longum]|uniref:hypothetical protein n=1 Tax=Stomatobaculum longum TaxID=796942 RepID=UPI0028EA4DEF|nr:hypothetical protein [Stomatobaculum longum]